jgi:hypothetical protein
LKFPKFSTRNSSFEFSLQNAVKITENKHYFTDLYRKLPKIIKSGVTLPRVTPRYPALPPCYPALPPRYPHFFLLKLFNKVFFWRDIQGCCFLGFWEAPLEKSNHKIICLNFICQNDKNCSPNFGVTPLLPCYPHIKSVTPTFSYWNFSTRYYFEKIFKHLIWNASEKLRPKYQAI